MSIKRILRYIPLMIMIIVVFAFSAMPSDESSDVSGRFLTPILNFVKAISHHDVTAITRDNIHWFIRKMAHFSEYAVLGITAVFALMPSMDIRKYQEPDKPRLFNVGALSLLISFINALSDELHQYFVPGRYMAFTDVLIDSAGALTGIFLFTLMIKKVNKKRTAR